MSDQETIQNVIIFDGEIEYSSEQIANDKNLTFLRNNVINLGGFSTSLIKKMEFCISLLINHYNLEVEN